MKVFNTTGVCVPKKHYMVNIENRLKKIKKLVDGEVILSLIRRVSMEKLLRSELESVFKE